MSSNQKPEPKKHLVVLEFTTDEAINPKFVPWAELLDGAVKITNWRDLTPELLQQYALGIAFDSFTSDSEFEDVKEAMAALRAAADAKEEVPDEITAWQPFEDLDAAGLLEHIQNAYTTEINQFSTLLQHEVPYA